MLAALAKELGHHLNQQALTLVTAESCTGGGLGFWLTSVPGSSAWFERGFITYTNQAKIEMLSVPLTTLDSYGAVSEATAKAMAEGALAASHANLSVAITGIAGPGGGTEDKPIGTIWIACAKRDQFVYAACYHFSGDREAVREQSILQAMQNLLTLLK